MEIVSAISTESAVFYIGTGEQVTLVAYGLTGDDVVNIEILDIEDNIQKAGNPCCPLRPVNLKVIGVLAAKCPNGKPMQLTANRPSCVIDTPQNIPLRVAVEADPAAIVTVDMVQSHSAYCNDCNCSEEAVTCEPSWVETGETRCVNHLIETKEEDGCGNVRWVASTTTCGFCASYPLLDGGFGFVEGDDKDPAATVEIAPCNAGETQTVYLFPTPRKGATAEQRDCDGVVIGYGMNQSPCAITPPSCNACTSC